MEYRQLSIPLFLEERSGFARNDEPVTVGIPLPRGAVFDPDRLTLEDPQGVVRPLQTQPLAKWSDGSLKWVLLDFQASVEADSTVVYQLRHGLEVTPSLRQGILIEQFAKTIMVDTGPAVFVLDPLVWRPFTQVTVSGIDMLTPEGGRFILTDEDGREYEPHIQNWVTEATGPLRVTLKMQGEFRGGSQRPFALFVARLNFYQGNSLVEMQFTLHNPRAAVHPGGLWDLGDQGSLYFQDLSLYVPVRQRQNPRIAWRTQPTRPLTEQLTAELQIYQDSSGGENWRSTNHVNRFGQVQQTFRGYRVTAEGNCLEEGLRATPEISLSNSGGGVTAIIDKFWQNFPKALEAPNNQLIVRLFPRQYNDVFELQGGEQKTHTLYLKFSGAELAPESLSWVHNRLIPRAMPEWYESSRSCLFISAQDSIQESECENLINTAISGPQSFFARREIIDEYGWRHFGDLYADHEAVRHTDTAPLVAHYNNQYDVIYGAIVQYLRSEDLRWFELARDLARHVIDIDIYHTRGDRPSYNGGLFWHTDHYLDAATSTHRAYSKASVARQNLQPYGGGPSNEQNYTTGLLHYYFLTGDTAAREAVQGLADWVVNMDESARSVFGIFDRRLTGLCSGTANRSYHGPGRGAGNSINALLDAHVLTREERYLTKAEQLIRRCIHPKDNIRERHLEDIEHRWSYTVFLQVLGKYLDLKAEKGEIDFMYCYAQASLLHYAEWMLVHEVPYSQVLDRVEIPTETWPAQDIRKSCVFHFAAKHAPEPLRSAFQRKADFFFQACIHDLRSWKTRTLTRPLVLLMTNAYVHSYFQHHPDETAPQPTSQYDFALPQQFSPQFAELYWLREKLRGTVQRLRDASRFLGNLSRKKPDRLGVLRG